MSDFHTVWRVVPNEFYRYDAEGKPYLVDRLAAAAEAATTPKSDHPGICGRWTHEPERT